MISKIKYSLDKFNLNLTGKVVLTEAATGAYSVTPVIAAMAGAKVYALAKESFYGSVEDIKKSVYALTEANVKSNIHIVQSLEEVTEPIDIVTNSGFVRPINGKVIRKLTSNSVISLMYEPWEFRDEDIDMESARLAGVKVYGTNEHDPRLKTMDYIGLTVLYLLLKEKISHFSAKKVLVLGNVEFVEPIQQCLSHNHYDVTVVTSYEKSIDVQAYDVIIVAENSNPRSIIGPGDSFIKKTDLDKSKLVIHICGTVDFSDAQFSHVPESPKKFGFMSFRTDYIDDQALIDLQTGSLLVAQGMLEAGKRGLLGKDYKHFMEKNYPALAFEDEKYW